MTHIRWTLVNAFSTSFLLPGSYSFQAEYGRADADADAEVHGLRPRPVRTVFFLRAPGASEHIGGFRDP